MFRIFINVFRLLCIERCYDIKFFYTYTYIFFIHIHSILSLFYMSHNWLNAFPISSAKSPVQLNWFPKTFNSSASGDFDSPRKLAVFPTEIYFPIIRTWYMSRSNTFIFPNIEFHKCKIYQDQYEKPKKFLLNFINKMHTRKKWFW